MVAPAPSKISPATPAVWAFPPRVLSPMKIMCAQSMARPGESAVPVPLKKSAEALFPLDLPANSPGRSSRMAMTAPITTVSKYSAETQGSRPGVSFLRRISASYSPSKDQCIPRTAHWPRPTVCARARWEDAPGPDMVHTCDFAVSYPGRTYLTGLNTTPDRPRGHRPYQRPVDDPSQPGKVYPASRGPHERGDAPPIGMDYSFGRVLAVKDICRGL